MVDLELPADPLPVCGACQAVIGPGEAFTGVHHEIWQWAFHEECNDN
ncbi:hypothetical protein [Streptomyces sp. CC53]|nr:hypothetical protein [Streptomyces sp. CC53]